MFILFKNYLLSINENLKWIHSLSNDFLSIKFKLVLFFFKTRYIFCIFKFLLPFDYVKLVYGRPQGINKLYYSNRIIDSNKI